MTGKKVLLVGLKGITWTPIEPMIERGLLPTFARLRREGGWGSPVSVRDGGARSLGGFRLTTGTRARKSDARRRTLVTPV